MPIYEYMCMKCNKDFEYLVLGNDGSVSCPECNSKKVKRQISACSFKSSGDFSASSGGSSGCASCSSGSCATCH
jgi:putative FmdB family regulatory protein